jgi:hypothetical protein
MTNFILDVVPQSKKIEVIDDLGICVKNINTIDFIYEEHSPSFYLTSDSVDMAVFADKGAPINRIRDKIHTDSLKDNDLDFVISAESNVLSVLYFQNGTIPENGVNGVTMESVLSVLIARTQYLNNKYPCDENKEAIRDMSLALDQFHKRTADRISRDVEGKLAE